MGRAEIVAEFSWLNCSIEAGEAYFAPPGHTPELYAGTEVVEFSPTAELERTLEVVLRNVDAAQT